MEIIEILEIIGWTMAIAVFAFFFIQKITQSLNRRRKKLILNTVKENIIYSSDVADAIREIIKEEIEDIQLEKKDQEE